LAGDKRQLCGELSGTSQGGNDRCRASRPLPCVPARVPSLSGHTRDLGADAVIVSAREAPAAPLEVGQNAITALQRAAIEALSNAFVIHDQKTAAPRLRGELVHHACSVLRAARSRHAVLGGRRHRAGALRPYRVPKIICLGAEVGGGAIDRFQIHQQVRALLRAQLRLNGRRWREPRCPRS